MRHRSPIVVGLLLALAPIRIAGQPSTALGSPNGVASVEFTRIVSVRELSDGRVLVSDVGESRLSLVDFDEARVDLVGGKGQGPGEYLAPGRLHSVGVDTTVLVDTDNGRWSLFAGSAFVATVPGGPFASIFEGSILGGDQDGHLLVERGISFTGSLEHPTAADSLALVLFDYRSQAVETVGRLSGAATPFHVRQPSNGRDGLIAVNPLAAQDQALLFPDGWIAVARLSPYRVDWRRADGTWLRGRPLPFQAVELSAADRCRVWRESWFGSSRPCDPDFTPEWPDVVPPFLIRATGRQAPVLLAAPGGQLLIRRAATAPPASVTYDLVDRNGSIAGVLQLPSNERLVGFGETSAYVVDTSEWDLQTLRRHPWLYDRAR